MTLAEAKDAIREMDPDLEEGTEAWNAALVLTGCIATNASAREVTEFTDLPPTFVQRCISRLRGNGILRPRTGPVREIAVQWFDEDGGIAFWLDVGVALGTLQRT